MGELTSTLGGPIVDSGLAAAIITGLMALAMVTTRQPTRRRALARAGVLGALLAIPLVSIRPYDPIDVVGPIRQALQPTFAWISGRLGFAIDLRGDLSHALVRDLPVGLLAAYLIGVGAGLGRMMLGLWGSGWIGRHSEAASRETKLLYESLALAVRRSRPRLRVSERARRPVLIGTFRTTILIPRAFDRPESADVIRLSLLHELAHAEALDPWFALAAELASILWFPLPMLWWIRRQIRLDQEFLADKQAAGRLGASSRYASSLVAIAAAPSASLTPWVGGPTNPSDGGSALFQRVVMLLRCPFLVEGQPPRWWRWCLTGSTAALLVVATGLTLRSPSSTTSFAKPPESRSFSMKTLVLSESAAAREPTVLPIRLPASFELSLKVFANGAELAQIRILGHSLTPERWTDNPLIEDPRRWHSVRLYRKSRRLSLAINSEASRDLPGNSVEERITLRSIPGRRTTFRTLMLTW